MLKSFTIILFFLFLGESLKSIFDFPIPGNIIGMFLIFIALQVKIIKLESVQMASKKLLQFLPLFFIPYGVGLIKFGDLLGEYALQISFVSFCTLLITMCLVGLVQQKIGE